MITISFYTDNMTYKGWKKLSKKHYQEFHSWVQSGNYLKINHAGTMPVIDAYNFAEVLVKLIK